MQLGAGEAAQGSLAALESKAAAQLYRDLAEAQERSPSASPPTN